MMKTAAILLAIVSAAAAAPAVVWINGVDQPQAAVHSSKALKAGDVLDAAFQSDSDELQVLFLLGRGEDGSETLSNWASSSSLPGIADKYSSAQSVHHHVAGMEGPQAVVGLVSKISPTAMQISLDEFHAKLQDYSTQPQQLEVDANGGVSKSHRATTRRARALAEAAVLVVTVPASTAAPADVDRAVVTAIESPLVSTVVLSAVRSHTEVKQERDAIARRRFEAQSQKGTQMMAARARRLEEGGEDGDNNNQDMSGVYYVQMTPNILAGILFFFLFATTAYIGISCMGMISGQTVYVDKMPTIGREA